MTRPTKCKTKLPALLPPTELAQMTADLQALIQIIADMHRIRDQLSDIMERAGLIRADNGHVEFRH